MSSGSGSLNEHDEPRRRDGTAEKHAPGIAVYFLELR